MDAIEQTRTLSERSHFTFHTDQDCKIDKITCDGGTVKDAGVGLSHKPRSAAKGNLWRKGETLRLIVEPDDDGTEVTVKVARGDAGSAKAPKPKASKPKAAPKAASKKTRGKRR